MALRKIGEAVTGTNGKCIIPYTGVGVGRLQMRGQYEEDERVILSGTYDIIDGSWLDDGVTSPKTKTWYNQGTSYTLTVESDGTLVSNSNSSSQALYADGTTFSNSFKWNKLVCVEFDILSRSGDNNSQTFVIRGNNTIYVSLNGTGHYKIYYDGEKSYKYLNGELIETPTSISMTTDCAIGFQCISGSFKYKNFVIYPI